MNLEDAIQTCLFSKQHVAWIESFLPLYCVPFCTKICPVGYSLWEAVTVWKQFWSISSLLIGYRCYFKSIL